MFGILPGGAGPGPGPSGGGGGGKKGKEKGKPKGKEKGKPMGGGPKGLQARAGSDATGAGRIKKKPGTGPGFSISVCRFDQNCIPRPNMTLLELSLTSCAPLPVLKASSPNLV